MEYTQVSVLTIDTWRRSGVTGLGFIIKAFQQSRAVLQWSRNRIFGSPFRVQLQHTFPVLAICVKKIRTISGVEVPRSLVTLLALSSSGFLTRQRNSTVILQPCQHLDGLKPLLTQPSPSELRLVNGENLFQR